MRAPGKKTGATSNYGPQVVAALAVAMVGGVVAMFKPVGDWVSSRVWREEIEIGQTVTVVEGQVTPLSLVLRNGSEMTGLSGGTVTLSPTDTSIELGGATTLTFPKADGSVTLPAEGGPTFVARTVGEQKIKVDVVTNRDRRFTGYVTVKSTAAEASVTESDLSGTWRVRLNERYGAMTLKQRSKGDLHLTGSIALEDGPTLTIADGFRDGVVFQISAEGPEATRYDVEGVWCAMSRSESKWMVVNAKAQGYAGERVLPAKAAKKRLEERCPDADAMLAETTGDGTFYASAPLS